MNHLYILNLYYHLYNVNTTSCYKKMCSTKTQISLINIQVWRLFSTPLMRVTHLTQRHWSNPILTLAHLFMTKCYSLENVFDDERKFPQTLLMNLGGKEALWNLIWAWTWLLGFMSWSVGHCRKFALVIHALWL